MACEPNLIGALLLQPQRIERASINDPSAALVADLLNLLTRLAVDGAQGARIVDVIGEATATSALNFLERSRAGIDQARQRLQKWLQGLLNNLSQLGEAVPEVDDPTQLVEAARQLLSRLTQVTENLSLDQLRRHVGELLDIIEKDLGLTSTFIEQQVWALIDEMIVGLEQMPPETGITERETRLEAASILRRVKRQMSGQFTFPQLKAEQIAGVLLALVRDSGLEVVARKVSCLGAGLNEALSAGTTLVDLVPYSSGFAGGGTVGAAKPRTMKATYCWYASWLLGNKKSALLKEGKVEHKGER